MPTAILITNPAAGNGRAARRALQVLDRLRAGELEVHARFGEQPGDTAILAQRAADQGADSVIVVGGDGSIHEAANGILGSSRPHCPLGIVPLGSGNDFVKMLGLDRDWRAACDRIISNATRCVDVGRIDGRYFTNGIGIGFDAEVALIAERRRWLGSDLMYAAALAEVLLRHRGNPELEICADGETWRQRALLIAAANGRCYGGSFKLAPDASLDDGALDLLVAGDLGRLGIIGLVPQVMRGSHLDHPKVSHRCVRQLSVASDRPLVVHADGEILYRDARSVEIQVVPGALTVLA
jgi:diacylglycerol kinase (ATP)